MGDVPTGPDAWWCKDHGPWWFDGVGKLVFASPAGDAEVPPEASAVQATTWTPPVLEPLERAHDVRRIRICAYCTTAGLSLVKVAPRRHAHGYCFLKAEGLSALGELPSVEIGKVRLNDVRALGIAMDDVLALLDAAEAREKTALTTITEGTPS